MPGKYKLRKVGISYDVQYSEYIFSALLFLIWPTKQSIVYLYAPPRTQYIV